MNPARRFIVNAFILGFLSLTFVSLALQREVWPICNYPMFRDLKPRKDGDLLIFFVVTGKGERRLTRHELPLLNPASVGAMFNAEGGPTDAARGFLGRILAEIRQNWEKMGQASPPPTGLRGYTIHYHYPDTGNFAPQVVSKTLRIEVGDSAP